MSTMCRQRRAAYDGVAARVLSRLSSSGEECLPFRDRPLHRARCYSVVANRRVLGTGVKASEHRKEKLNGSVVIVVLFLIFYSY